MEALVTKEKYFVHQSSYVERDVSVGIGTEVGHFCHIMSKARIGRNCTIAQNIFIDRNVTIGDNVTIQNNVSVYEGVTLEDDVFVGTSAVFTNVLTPRASFPRNRPQDIQKTLVKRGATIGANATIACGTTVGVYAFIGAGAVLTRDAPDHALMMGVPARVSGWVCACGRKIAFNEQNEARCTSCRRNYVRIGGQVREK
jgi:UDP-2-acetamido-3-amino-2,3-dideoxy-glucuronate N-acetyltransferase